MEGIGRLDQKDEADAKRKREELTAYMLRTRSKPKGTVRVKGGRPLKRHSSLGMASARFGRRPYSNQRHP